MNVFMFVNPESCKLRDVFNVSYFVYSVRLVFVLFLLFFLFPLIYSQATGPEAPVSIVGYPPYPT